MQHEQAPLPPEVCAPRRAALQERLAERERAGRVLLQRANRLYFTGFGPHGGSLTRRGALCVPARGEPAHLIRDIDRERAAAAGPVHAVPASCGEGPGLVAQAVSGWPAGSVGIGAGEMPLAVAHGCAPQSHEPSRWDASSAVPPRAGRVLATEPAICFGGVGLRLEDDVAVRPGGGQSLNRAPMDLSR